MNKQTKILRKRPYLVHFAAAKGATCAVGGMTLINVVLGEERHKRHAWFLSIDQIYVLVQQLKILGVEVNDCSPATQDKLLVLH